MAKREDDELEAWEAAIGARPAHRVEVIRLEPKVFEGRRIAGKLATFDYLPEVEDLQGEFGGGRFRLIVKTPDAKGRLVYRLTRTAQIAGSPKVPTDAELALDEADRDRIVREIARQAARELYEDRLAELEAAISMLLPTS
jgi:hypothetical protein